MSTPEGPEFSTGEPLPPAETQPTVPEFTPVAAPQSKAEAPAPAPPESGEEVWVHDPVFGRIPHRPTEPTWGDDVAKRAATGAFTIEPSEASKPVPTTLPGFYDQDPIEAIHADEPTTPVAEHVTPEPEAELPESFTAAADTQPVPTPEPESEPAEAENATTEAASTSVRLGGKIAPAQPTSGRHTLMDFSRLVQPRTVEAPTAPVADTPQVPPPKLPRRIPDTHFPPDRADSETATPADTELPAASRTVFPKRVPQAELPAIKTALRAARAGEFTAHCLGARRAALADLAAETSGAEPPAQSADEEWPTHQGSPTAGLLFRKGADLTGLENHGTVAEAAALPSTLSTILSKGINAQGEATLWPGGTEVDPGNAQ